MLLPSFRLLFALAFALTFGAGCTTPLERARQAQSDGDHESAAALLLEAAAAEPCPKRGELLLERATLQDLSSNLARSGEAVHRAVAACPSYAPARWALAQLLLEQGKSEEALAEALEVREQFPEAAAMTEAIEAQQAKEQQLRTADHDLVRELRRALNLETKDEPLPSQDPGHFKRQVPLPMTLDYAVHLEASAPQAFSIDWKERLSYQGDPAADSYRLVRFLEAPDIDRELPVYFRLELANQKLPMRFTIDSRGSVVDASWQSEGPNRGMRPEMLKPAIEGALKRRRLFDPGETGARKPGDRWGGETIRIVDGKPVPVEYNSEAISWVRTLGIATLHIRTKLHGEGYRGSEEVWLHPETAVEVRWRRHHAYGIEAKRFYDQWDELREGALVAVGGVE